MQNQSSQKATKSLENRKIISNIKKDNSESVRVIDSQEKMEQSNNSCNNNVSDNCAHQEVDSKDSDNYLNPDLLRIVKLCNYDRRLFEN